MNRLLSFEDAADKSSQESGKHMIGNWRKNHCYVLAEYSDTKMCLMNQVILIKRFPSTALKVVLSFFLSIYNKNVKENKSIEEKLCFKKCQDFEKNSQPLKMANDVKIKKQLVGKDPGLYQENVVQK